MIKKRPLQKRDLFKKETSSKKRPLQKRDLLKKETSSKKRPPQKCIELSN